MAEAFDVGLVGKFGMSLTEAACKIWQMLFSARDGTFPLTVTGTVTTSQAGAANLACATGNVSNVAATLAVARPTRRSILIRNNDAAINVYVGPATVSSTNGVLIKPGEAVALSYVGLIQVIAASATPSVSIADEYD